MDLEISNQEMRRFSTFFIGINSAFLFSLCVVLFFVFTPSGSNFRNERTLNDQQIEENHTIDLNLTLPMLPLDPSSPLKKKILKEFVELSYVGTWSTNNTFSNFSRTKGKMRLLFQIFHNYKGVKGYFYQYNFYIYDGDDKDHWVLVKNIFPYSLNDKQTSIIIDKNKRFTVISAQNPMLWYEMKMLDTYNREIKETDMKMNYETDDKGGSVGESEKIEGRLEGGSGKLWYEIMVESPSVYNKVSNFALFLAVIGFLQVVGCKYLLDTFSNNEMEALNYSPYTFIINVIWNCIVSFECFLAALYDERLFNDFIVPTVIFFVNFCYFEIKLIFQIWKVHLFNGNNSAGVLNQIADFRRRLLKLYVIFYIILITILLYAFELFFWKPLIYANTFITWIPQIFHNMKTRQRKRISWVSLTIISISQIIIPLYFRGCPKNFLDFKPDLTFTITITSIMLVEIFIVAVQHRCCTCIRIPRYMMPNIYDYQKTITELKNMHIELENMTCTICMGLLVNRDEKSSRHIKSQIPSLPLNEKDTQNLPATTSIPNEVTNSNSDSATLTIKSPRISTVKSIALKAAHCISKIKCKCHLNSLQKDTFMLTPCNHLFHSECLKPWMEIKRSCPQCRSDLPALYDEN